MGYALTAALEVVETVLMRPDNLQKLAGDVHHLIDSTRKLPDLLIVLLALPKQRFQALREGVVALCHLSKRSNCIPTGKGNNQ
jgi:hypothetical protein